MATSGFEGENFKICHSIRAGKKYHLQKAARTCDLVVIGAGISGLTAAYNTKDKLDLEVIEKEPRPGGASKRNCWKGIYYSLGAADTGPTYEAEIEGKKTNFLENLFQELHIKWRKVPDPSFAVKYGNQLIVDPLHNQSTEDRLVNDFKQSFEDAQNRLETVFEEYGRPIIPLEASPNKTMELDKTTFAEIFEGVSGPFRSYLQTFSNATFGAPALSDSAYWRCLFSLLSFSCANRNEKKRGLRGRILFLGKRFKG